MFKSFYKSLQRLFPQSNNRPSLYRRTVPRATIALLLLLSVGAAHAQNRLHKKRKGPRAIAVVRWDANTKDLAVPTLIPVTILDDGAFNDASFYKDAPAPMPLLDGIVYEAQDKGEILGYFTIKNQTHALQKQNWIALGSWQSASPKFDDKLDVRQAAQRPRDKSASSNGSAPGDTGDDRDLKKTTTTVYDENGKEMPAGTKASPADPLKHDQRPTLKGGKGSADDAKADSKNGDAKSGGADTSADDPDRPTLKRQSGSTPAAPAEAGPAQTAPAVPGTANASAGDPSETRVAANDPDVPQLRRGKPRDPSPAAETTVTKGPVDPDRPVIRRGRTGADANQASAAIPVPPRVLARGPRIGEDLSSADEPRLKRTRTYEAVAVSDATPQDPENFRFKMPEGERDTLRAKVTQAAQQQINVFLRSIGQAGAAQTAAPAKPQTRATVAKKRTPPVSNANFAESQFEVYDLSHRNDPILVFSGRQRTNTARGAVRDVFITYVAGIDIDGNPRKLFSNVTSSDRLDVTAKLDLIDAVDAYGDGLGQFLFRRQKDDGADFALYEVSYDGLKEIFHGAVAD